VRKQGCRGCREAYEGEGFRRLGCASDDGGGLSGDREGRKSRGLAHRLCLERRRQWHGRGAREGRELAVVIKQTRPFRTGAEQRYGAPCTGARTDDGTAGANRGANRRPGRAWRVCVGNLAPLAVSLASHGSLLGSSHCPLCPFGAEETNRRQPKRLTGSASVVP
jgi:hypothetical protein